MSFIDYLEQKLLDEVLGAVDFLAPATLYVGLSTATVGDDGSGISEPVGNGYARVAVTNNKTNWTAAGGTPTNVKNAVAITFPTATGSWGTVVDFFIADAAVAGNILIAGVLTTAKTISTGDTASFAVNKLEVRLD